MHGCNIGDQERSTFARSTSCESHLIPKATVAGHDEGATLDRNPFGNKSIKNRLNKIVQIRVLHEHL